MSSCSEDLCSYACGVLRAKITRSFLRCREQFARPAHNATTDPDRPLLIGRGAGSAQYAAPNRAASLNTGHSRHQRREPNSRCRALLSLWHLS
jgi:hypothetical protein